MATKADFTGEEWARLERAPIVAGMAISLADPGGPIEAFKETNASVRSILDTALAEGQNELVESVAKGAAEKARARQNPIGDFRPKGATAGQEILNELTAVNQLLTDKATPEEADAFREWLLGTAQRVAEAAKEGGFMGFRAERVSEGEQRMLEQLRQTLSA
jgi:hypothetical protein